jgi:hypothetical protein
VVQTRRMAPRAEATGFREDASHNVEGKQTLPSACEAAEIPVNLLIFFNLLFFSACRHDRRTQ